VHQCGIGSVGLVLRAGRPMVGVPHAHDQFHNALLAERLGTAAVVPRHRLTLDRLCGALGRVLAASDFAARAAALGAKLQHEDGAAAATMALERLAASR
jgi:UDP:flavonoid glycosyltransferase YjiC (YdhE family)